MGEMARAELEAAVGRHLESGELAAAATAAIRGYGPEILGYLAAVLRDDDAAADAFSRFAEDLWKGLPGFRRKSSMRTWAYRVAWNAAQDTIADAFRRRGRRLTTGEMSRLAASVRSTSAEFLADAAKARLQAMRANLKPEEQTLLILRVNRGLSWNEVGEVLSTDSAAVRKRYERLKDKLRKMARDERQAG